MNDVGSERSGKIAVRVFKGTKRDWCFLTYFFSFLSVISLLISYLTRLLSTQVTYHLTSLIFFVQRTAYTFLVFIPYWFCTSFVFTASFRAVWLSLLSPFFARLMLSGTGRFYFLHPYSRLAPYRSCRYRRRGVYRLSWHVCLTRCHFNDFFRVASGLFPPLLRISVGVRVGLAVATHLLFPERSHVAIYFWGQSQRVTLSDSLFR